MGAGQQIVVRFPEGSFEACEIDGPWTGFVHEGRFLAWCSVRTASGLPAIAVRTRDESEDVIGSTVPRRRPKETRERLPRYSRRA